MVVAKLDGAGPASAAPSALAVTRPAVPDPSDTLWPLPGTTDAAGPTVPSTPVALPAPTVLPIEGTAIAALRTSPPALPEPPQTPLSESPTTPVVPEAAAPEAETLRPAAPETDAGPPIASLPEVEAAAVTVEPPQVEPEAPTKLPEPPVSVPETDISALQAVPADLLATAPPTSLADMVEPAADSALPTSQTRTGEEARAIAALPAVESEKEKAEPAPVAEATPKAIGAPSPTILPQAPITVPEIDISALTSVPADLAAPPVQPETPAAPIPAETPKAEAGDAATRDDVSKPVAALTPQAEAEARTDAAVPQTPASPDVLPTINLSALRSVPADLTASANPSPQPGPAEPVAGSALPTSLPSSQVDPAEPVADVALPTSNPSAAEEAKAVAALPEVESEANAEPEPSPVAEATPQPDEAPRPAVLPQAPVIVPEIDISALTSVPADLAAAPVQPETPAALPIPAKTPESRGRRCRSPGRRQQACRGADAESSRGTSTGRVRACSRAPGACPSDSAAGDRSLGAPQRAARPDGAGVRAGNPALDHRDRATGRGRRSSG